jgi:hypothetical protein
MFFNLVRDGNYLVLLVLIPVVIGTLTMYYFFRALLQRQKNVS